MMLPYGPRYITGRNPPFYCGHHSAVWASTRYDCPSCLWSAEQKKYVFPSPFAPKNFVSQDRSGCPVPHQPVLHTQAESGAYGLKFLLSLSAAVFIFTANRQRGSLKCIRSRTCIPMAFTAERPPAGDQ